MIDLTDTILDSFLLALAVIFILVMAAILSTGFLVYTVYSLPVNLWRVMSQ